MKHSASNRSSGILSTSPTRRVLYWNQRLMIVSHCMLLYPCRRTQSFCEYPGPRNSASIAPRTNRMWLFAAESIRCPSSSFADHCPRLAQWRRVPRSPCADSATRVRLFLRGKSKDPEPCIIVASAGDRPCLTQGATVPKSPSNVPELRPSKTLTAATFGNENAGDLPVDAHELVALCAPRPTFISYGVPENGDAKCLDHQESYMATVTAGPVFRLLGAKDLGTTDDYRTEKMPAVNVSMMGNQLHSTVKGYQVWADALRP